MPADDEPEETVPTNLRLTPTARAALEAIARRRGLRYSAIVVEQLAREELARLEAAAGGVP